MVGVAREMHFDENAPPGKSTRDKFLIKLPKSPALIVGSPKQTFFSNTR